MTTDLNWNDVVSDPTEPLEFGACHVNAAWRRHRTPQSKFQGLHSAFVTSNHRLPILLQAVESNQNARNHPERGQAIFAAVWSRNAPWAVLCDATHAALVPKNRLEEIGTSNIRNDEVNQTLRALIDSCPPYFRTPLDDSFYDRMLDREA